MVNEASTDSENQECFQKIYPLIRRGLGKKLNDIMEIYSKSLSPAAKKNLAARRPAFEQLQQVYAKIIENSNSSDIIRAEIEEGKIIRSANGLFIMKTKDKPEAKEKEIAVKHTPLPDSRQPEKLEPKDKDAVTAGATTSSSITEVKWDKLSVLSLYNIVNVKGGYLDDSPDLLKIKIALLTGELCQVGDLLRDRHEYDFLVDAIIANAVEEVKISALIDRKSAAPKAQAIMKQFAGVPGFKQYEAEIKPLTSPDTIAPMTVPTEPDGK